MKKSELRSLIREHVKTILKEADMTNSGQNEYKEGDLIKFKDDKEVWQVVKAGMRNSNDRVQSNEVTIKPYDALAKRNNVSVPIDITIEYLNANTEKINESVIKEATTYSFTLTYNDAKYVQQVLDDAGVDALAKAGVDDEEVIVRAFDGMGLRKAKQALKSDHFDINENVIKEAKEYSFTFNYNTDEDDVEYIQNLIMDSGADATAEPGIDSEEMVIKAKNAVELRKAKKAIEANGFQINEADDPEAGEAAPYGSGYSKVNEDAGMVIDVAMGVAVGLMGLWSLVQSAPLVGRVFGNAAEYLADKSAKKAKLALKDKRKETIAPIIAKFKNDTKLADMYQALTPYSAAAKLGSSQAGLKAQQGRVNQLTKIGNYIKSKLTPEELVYFRDISAMLRDGDIK